MRMRHAALLAAALFTLGACEIPGAPKWNIDVFFPLRYPDVQINQYVPGGFVPPVNVAFMTPADSDDVSDATRRVFDEDIETLAADLIFSNQTSILGNLEISIAANRAFLFSSDPAQAVTRNIILHITPTAGDTTHFTVNTNLFKNAQKLYTQSRGNIRSSAGPLAVTATDRFRLGVDLTANVKFSKEGTP